MQVGVAAIGYGDGYPRSAEAGTPVLVGDRRVPLIGRVSMDLITIDLRDAPDAHYRRSGRAVGARSCRWKLAAHPARSATS